MQGTTIEITLWRGIADKFYDHIEEGQVRIFTEEHTRLHSSYCNKQWLSGMNQILCVQDRSTQPYCSMHRVKLSQQRHD